MSLFTRITATVAASVDNAVTRVEDHNAVIEASLSQTRKAAASARVRLARVEKDHAALLSRHRQIVSDIDTWTERARRSTDDENRAIECLARRKKCRQELTQVEQTLAGHADLKVSLAQNVAKIETRIREINEQRNLLRTRESVAEANKIIENLNCSDVGDVERTFDRWEERVGESELFHQVPVSNDPLATSFDNDENRQELLNELAELKEEKE